MVATRLAAAAARMDHEVHILAHDNEEHRGEIDAMTSGVPGYDRVQTHLIPPDGGLSALRQPTLRARVAALCDRNTVVQLHGVWEPMLHAAARAAERAGSPYALTPHGMLDPYSLRVKPWKKRLALALGARATLARAAFLHALNADEATLLDPLRLPSPVVVIPNGIFLEELSPLPPAGAFRTAHPEVGDAPFVLFLSRLHHKKGLDHLADAFALLAPRMPGVRLVVAGPDGGARAPLEAQIARAGLGERVHLVGPVYGTDKLAALVDAACFCLPSRQEGFSIAITEALACGLPVVISENCHFPEVAEAGAGWVVPLDAPRVADALEAVLREPDARGTLGARGRHLVEQRFTWPRVAERFCDAYDDILAGRPPRDSLHA